MQDGDGGGDASVPSVLPAPFAAELHKRDVLSTIEHLITVGCHYRHLSWRVNDWRNRHLSRKRKRPPADTNAIQESDRADSGTIGTRSKSSDNEKRQKRRVGDDSGSEDGSVYEPDHRSSSDESERISEEEEEDNAPSDKEGSSTFADGRRVIDVHAQDVILYGNNYVQPLPWPKKGLGTKGWSRSRGYFGKVMDKAWDVMFGDNVNPVVFAESRLSQVPSGQRFDPQDDNVDAKDGPRAFILHCWERAVHASSSSIEVSSTDMKDDMEAHGFVDLEQKMVQRKSASTIITKGEPLNEPEMKMQSCPICQSRFDSAERRACCGQILHQERVRKVRETLEGEVEAQLEQLLTFVFREFSEDPQRQDLIRWSDILALFQQKLHESIPSTNKPPDVTDTLQVNPKEAPLVINDLLLQAIERRLVNRYTDLPK